MKAIRDRVLIEQTFTKKISTLITSLDQSKPSADEYKVITKLLQLGGEIKDSELQIGDIIFLNNFATPQKVEKISGEVGSDKIVNHAIFSYDDIIGKE